MRGWLKQVSKFILSAATSVVLLYPTISFSADVIDEKPSAFEMFGDAIFVRPLLVVATAVGTAVFIVTLPFSAMGGNTKEVADVLVGTPADSLLFRCLGCSEQEDLARDEQKAEVKKEKAAAAAAAKEEAARKEAEAEKAQAAVDAAAEEAEREKAAARWKDTNPQCKNLWC